MADPAPALVLGTAILKALRGVDASASNDGPRFVSLASEAARRGYSTRSFRAWCVRRGVPIREGSHREAWVSPADVDRAIEGLPVAAAPPSVDDEVDASVRAAQDRRRR